MSGRKWKAPFSPERPGKGAFLWRAGVQGLAHDVVKFFGGTGGVPEEPVNVADVALNEKSRAAFFKNVPLPRLQQRDVRATLSAGDVRDGLHAVEQLALIG